VLPTKTPIQQDQKSIRQRYISLANKINVFFSSHFSFSITISYMTKFDIIFYRSNVSLDGKKNLDDVAEAGNRLRPTVIRWGK
jgi:hypothetical protein